MIDRDALAASLANADPAEMLAAGLEITGRGAAAMARATQRTPEEDRLLDMEAVAKVLGVPEGQARDMGRRGELPVIHLGRYVRVRASTLSAWLEARESGRLAVRRAG